jgi:hypothetical protein
MFKNNKYTRWYFAIIFKSKDLKVPNKTELHHVLPQSIFPEYAKLSKHKWNGVHLTFREHFMCHWLLTKMMKSTTHYHQMAHALNAMMHLENKHQQRYKISSRIHSLLKKKYALVNSARMLKNNPMSRPEIKLKHAVAVKKRGATPGNTGNNASAETIAKMKIARARQIITEETKEKLRTINILKSKEPKFLAEKEAQSKKFTGTIGFHNPVTGQYKYFKKESIPAGWVKGRRKQTT